MTRESASAQDPWGARRRARGPPLAFRLLVWGPAVATAAGRGLPGAERDDALRHGQRLFWRAFWALVVLAGAAETAVLAVGFAVWQAESAEGPSAGRRGLLTVMGLLGVSALALLAGQGHASQAPIA